MKTLRMPTAEEWYQAWFGYKPRNVVWNGMFANCVGELRGLARLCCVPGARYKIVPVSELIEPSVGLEFIDHLNNVVVAQQDSALWDDWKLDHGVYYAQRNGWTAAVMPCKELPDAWVQGVPEAEATHWHTLIGGDYQLSDQQVYGDNIRTFVTYLEGRDNARLRAQRGLILFANAYAIRTETAKQEELEDLTRSAAALKKQNDELWKRYGSALEELHELRRAQSALLSGGPPSESTQQREQLHSRTASPISTPQDVQSGPSALTE